MKDSGADEFYYFSNTTIKSYKMNPIKSILPPRIFEVVDRAGISTAKQIMILSKWDIKKLTNFNLDDISLLKSIVADYISPEKITGNVLLLERNLYPKISTGCEAINLITRGGFQRGTLTEIFGESGSGKTQIGIQATAHNSVNGCVYICTEDLFPVKRLEQIKCSIPNYNHKDDCGKNIFIEHVTEPTELMSCVKVRMPKLLSKNKVSLIVLDSIAAPYRSDTTNYIQRAEELRELAISLIRTAQMFNIGVLCINQVTAAFDGTDDSLPSLGLAWSNMVTTRLRLRKTSETIYLRNESSSNQVECAHVRELSIVFAPDLSNKTTRFIVTATGIVGV